MSVVTTPTGKSLSPKERLIREIADKMGYRGNVGAFTAQHQPISKKPMWQSPRFLIAVAASEEVAGP